MKIIYCHHANRKKGNPPGPNDDITTLGKKDAKNIATLLKDVNKRFPISTIYSSPFLRCKKTANIINKHVKAPIVLDERFNEKDYNGNEGWVDCQNRIKSGILDVIKKHDNSDTVVIVTSGVNVASFINLAYGIEASETTPYLGLSMCCPILFNIDKEKIELN